MQIGLEVLRDLPHQPMEQQLANEELGGLLVLTDLTKRHGSGHVFLWEIFTPPVAGADLWAALVASCLWGTLLLMNLRAVYLVRAMAQNSQFNEAQNTSDRTRTMQGYSEGKK